MSSSHLTDLVATAVLIMCAAIVIALITRT